MRIANKQHETGGEIAGLKKQIKALQAQVRDLQATQNILHSILDTNPNHLSVKDGEGAFVFANKAMADVYNLSPQELIGKKERDCNPDVEEIARFHAEDKEVLRTGRPLMIAEEQRISPETGNSRWVQTVKMPLQLKGKDSRYVLGVSTDITERKLTELLLSETEERYKSLFSDAPVMYIITRQEDGEAIIEDCNALFCDTLKYTRNEVIGRKLADFYTPASRRKLNEGGYLAALDGTFQIQERQLMTNDNQIVDTLLNAIPAPHHAHKSCGTFAMYLDISRQKSLEKQLRQAQKMEAIGTLAGGIAHDFNNILAAILGYSELNLQDFEEGSEYFANSEKIYQAALRARDLVRQILIFSHQREYEYRETRIDIVVKEALKLLRATLPSTIAIKQSIDRQCCLVKADPSQIHQVVMNLCTNSFHAMRRFGGELSVTLKRSPAEEVPDRLREQHPDVSGFMRLTIRDTGSGIPPHIIERIFDPFFTTKKMGEGTGIGLAVVHGIIQRHEGIVDVESVVDEGTKVDILLPAVVKTIPENTFKKEKMAGGTEHILLVDDEDVIVNASTRMLERLGYQVTATSSSFQALELFQTRAADFDLVLTDQTMPDLTGLQLAEAILAIRPGIPVVLMSGFNELSSTATAQAAGIQYYLDKPIRMADISSTVRHALDNRMQKAAISSP